ncbi:MAG: DinB family protein [Dehalococcoidia bacterium]|nr:DinB family protein [Dehalococcoidia bacterium]
MTEQLGPARLDEAVAWFEENAAAARAVIVALSPESLRVVPDGEPWNVASIVSHMGAALHFSLAVEAVMRGGPPLGPEVFAENRAKVEAAAGASKEDLLAAFDEGVAAFRQHLASLDEEEYGRVYTMRDPFGRETTWSSRFGVWRQVTHLQEHVAQIRDWLARGSAPTA